MQQQWALIVLLCIGVQQLEFNILRLSFEKRCFKRVRSSNVINAAILLTIIGRAEHFCKQE
jgi:hypothetical protein